GVAMTPVQALEYALSRPAVAAVMAGCRSREELQAALDWCTASREERDYSVVLSKVDKCSWTGHCMYCGHCAPCPAGIGVADVNKFLNLALAQGQLPETVREHYKALDHHASECIRCGACERRCPFGVPVRDRMAQAVRIFGE
ncbi:MAG: 4Fe-4S dicluster domain-containing protein, partial [Lentisphaeria bacterium]|nr:4Fe-4S dicluster domain-containing protein [Lentisphaeria bacterium]